MKKEKMLAEECFERESALFAQTKTADVITAVLFCVILFGVLLTAILLPDREKSEQENRMLETFPAISTPGHFADRLFDGSFGTAFTAYCSDQFPGRDVLVGVEGIAELALGKGENNGVILGKGGYLLTKPAAAEGSYLDKNVAAVAAFDTDLPVTLAVPGRTVDVALEQYPALYGGEEAARAWDVLRSALQKTDLDTCDLLTPLRAVGSRTMYRTDHHWTSEGAYYAYAALMEHFGKTPYPQESFSREVVSEEFLGTSWSAAGFKFVAPEKMEYYRYPQDDAARVRVLYSDIEQEGFYDRSYLSGKDKYASFLGGNFALVTVERDASLPWMVLYKDSFANSLVPFLARHYNLVLVDPRYYRVGLADTLEGKNVERVLFLYNMDTLLTDPYVAMAPGLDD